MIKAAAMWASSVQRRRSLQTAELYDLASDISETRNVASRHPDIVRRLEAMAEKARAELADSLTGRKGAGIREPGRMPRTGQHPRMLQP